ncbi:DUF1566 domain-containing protein [Cohaesibacter sp. CAU 1516]|uniref:Lcl C-terminal domain-containing protein n=1 Tax=Cohaesibacter sp. CAU 1516 TaxID=2576038 RepID=UPI001AEF1C4C|nr:DUF1566 domain-containing protein [Cohaesibacter sp. CAU 1516]
MSQNTLKSLLSCRLALSIKTSQRKQIQVRSKVIPLFLLSLLPLPLGAHADCGTGKRSSYILQEDEAIDPQHGLIWKRCAVGMRWDANGKTCIGEVQVLGLNAALDFTKQEGNGWRVPSGQELETLLVNSCDHPGVDAIAFPSIEASDFGEGAKFWTSTEAIPGMFYYFDFTNGFVDMHSQGFRLSVLLVKDIKR